MTAPLHEYRSRDAEDEMVRRVYQRSLTLKRQRAVRVAVGSAVVVALIVGGVVLGLNLGTSRGHKTSAGSSTAPAHLSQHVLAVNQAAVEALGVPATSEPAPRLAASGSGTAPAPSLPHGFSSQYPAWMGLLTNGLKVFKSTLPNGGQAVVQTFQSQPDKRLTLASGPYAGQSITISEANGSVDDTNGNSWRLSAILSSSGSGGTLALQGKCQWQPSEPTGSTGGTSQIGSCENLVINLPDTSTTTGATISQWLGSVSRVTISGSPNTGS